MKNSIHEIFYTRPETVKGKHFILENQEFHHAFKVLRKTIGDVVTAVDGEGGMYTGVIVRKLMGKRVECRIDKTVIKSNEPITEAVLCIGLIKANRFEIIIEKGVEIGVKRIVPLITERSFREVSAHKLARWEHIAIAAMKQCQRSVLPEISQPLVFNQVLESRERFDIRLIAHNEQGSRHYADLLKDIKKRPLKKIAVLIGPEGGFTEKEIRSAEADGFVKVKFGERRLRTETAAIVALTTVLFSQFDI